MAQTIAYGRISPGQETVGRRFQRQSIRAQVGTGKVDIQFDTVEGDFGFSHRPALLMQLLQARQLGVPLAVESMDRIYSGYDGDQVARFKSEVDKFDVQIAVAHINQPILRRIRRILASPKKRQHQRRSLVRAVDSHLRWRQSTVFSVGRSENGDSELVPYANLKTSNLFSVLTTCADHLMRLEIDSPDLEWCIHSFLGAGWEARTRLLMEQKTISGGQVGYGQRPDDPEMFQAIHKLEQEQLTTWDGRPMAMSSQRIATELNRLGFRNLRGVPFSRKTIFQLRRSPAYLGTMASEKSA